MKKNWKRTFETVGILIPGLAQATVADFTAPGYAGADLTSNMNWNKDSGNIVSVAGSGFNGARGIVTLPSSGEYVESVYNEALPMIGTGDTATIKLRFQYTSTGDLTASQSGVLAAQFNETASGGDILILAVRRRNTGKVQLFGSNAGGGNIFSTQIDETAVGITNNTDTSHWLELTAPLTKGSSADNWLLGGTLTNLTFGGAHVVTQPATAITPPINIVNSGSIYGGINSRRLESANMAHPRIIDTFEVYAGTALYISQPFASHDTGYTIAKVRSAQAGSSSFIVASSYEGTLLGMDYDDTVLWTNELSGFMNRDVWCDDLTDDGTDEILTANFLRPARSTFPNAKRSSALTRCTSA